MLAIVCGGIFYSQLGPKIEKTVNKDSELLQKNLQESLEYLRIDEKGAHLKMLPNRMRLFRDTGDSTRLERLDDYTLQSGESIRTLDHHSMLRLTVKSISSSAMVFEYTDTFDHRSFGKDLITMDMGEFTLRPFERGAKD
ncbi:MAG: hypothetical protein EBR02_02600 [Alphaproteobacteria bacterium]|nr:hypothetical protein [Alphaproteobacteria bacterium]